MKIRHLMMVAAASGVVAAPAMAAPAVNAASSLSLVNTRVASRAGQKEKLVGAPFTIGLVAAAAIGVGIYFAVRSNKDNAASN